MAGLLDFKHEMGTGYDSFAAMMSNQAEGDGGEGINHDELISPLLRRGRRITDDTRSSEESEESEEEGEGSDKPDPVAWSMPDGFTLGAEPSKLDASLEGKHIYMRWMEAPTMIEAPVELTNICHDGWSKLCTCFSHPGMPSGGPPRRFCGVSAPTAPSSSLPQAGITSVIPFSIEPRPRASSTYGGTGSAG